MKKWMDLIMEFDADEMRRKRQYEYDESCAGEFKEKKERKKGIRKACLPCGLDVQLLQCGKP